MRSIDKLREWANGLHGVYVNKVDHTITVTTGWDAPPDMDSVNLRDHVNGILDGIEQEVADMRGFCERLDDAATKREDVTLWGVDYTPYPLDADGEPIHVGDWITGKWDAKAKVVAITSEDVYWWEPDGCHWCHAYEVHHHHAPTVEDVLQEFAQEMNENLCMYTGEAIDADEWREADERTIAEYAARLRLVGDE